MLVYSGDCVSLSVPILMKSPSWSGCFSGVKSNMSDDPTICHSLLLWKITIEIGKFLRNEMCTMENHHRNCGKFLRNEKWRHVPSCSRKLTVDQCLAPGFIDHSERKSLVDPLVDQEILPKDLTGRNIRR